MVGPVSASPRAAILKSLPKCRDGHRLQVAGALRDKFMGVDCDGFQKAYLATWRMSQWMSQHPWSETWMSQSGRHCTRIQA